MKGILFVTFFTALFAIVMASAGFAADAKPPYEVVKIADGFWAIQENGVRSFLVVGKDKAMLVDTGRGVGNMKEVVDSLTSLPIMLVNTHADGDHIGCNEQFGGEAWLHPAEFDKYRNGKGMEKAKPNALWEGDIIDLGGRKFEVILIPGHTPGSIVLLDRAGRIMISGDSVQNGVIYMFGAGRNIDAYIFSMEKLAKIQDTFDKAYPAHGDIEVPASIIPKLKAGAEKVRAGEIPGAPPGRDIPAQLFNFGDAGFFYQP